MLREDGALLGAASAPHQPFTSLEAAWAEQDPADWWQACRSAISAVLAETKIPGREIACIGLTGQMHGTVALNESGAVLRPSIIWCDQRGEEECDCVTEKIGAQLLSELTANPAITNFTLIKLLWLRKHEPRTWNQIHHLLLPKDYVRFCLSGEYAIDVAEASGTLMLDVANRCWSTKLLELLELDPQWLPKLFESPEICARVSEEGARMTGLMPGTPIVAGAGDQAAGAVGMGITRSGMVSSIIGTSGVVFASSDRPVRDPEGRLHTFCHAIPNRWHLMGVTQAAGLSMRWLRDQILGGEQEGWSYDRITGEASQVSPGSEGLLWGPFLMGERTPYCDPKIRAGLVGIDARHTLAHVCRAVMEGVAFSLRESLDLLRSLGMPVKTIRAGGGGARSPLWRQIQADVFGLPVETVQSDEGPAFGAALLAGVGARIWSDVDKACDAVVHTAHCTRCQPDCVPVLDECYRRYQRVYPALRTLRLPSYERIHA